MKKVNKKKSITIFQVVMLILSILASVYSYILSAISLGLGGIHAKSLLDNFPQYFFSVSVFILIGFVVILILRKIKLVCLLSFYYLRLL